MKTTIYELLGMVKDDKAPKKIKYGNYIYTYQEHIADYSNEDDMNLFDGAINTFMLNDKVEILDEPKKDKIEKVNTYVLCDSDFHTRYKDGYSLKATEIIDKAFEEYSYKINEIIDKLSGDKENE